MLPLGAWGVPLCNWQFGSWPHDSLTLQLRVTPKDFASDPCYWLFDLQKVSAICGKEKHCDKVAYLVLFVF